jgi:hypothetical protein
MMTPVKHGAQQRRQDQQGHAQPDHAIGHVGGQAVLHDQGDKPPDHQQRGQAGETAMTMAVAVVMVPMVMITVVMMVSVAAMAAPAMLAAFIEREFIAHPNIYFAHSISLYATGLAAEENIINISSYFKLYHQIIIILS